MAGTIEDFTNEVMELRQDINNLTEAMMKRKHLTITADVSIADATVIQNARELIQRLIEAETV